MADLPTIFIWCVKQPIHQCYFQQAVTILYYKVQSNHTNVGKLMTCIHTDTRTHTDAHTHSHCHTLQYN